MRALSLISIACGLLAGCSIVNDPGAFTGGTLDGNEACEELGTLYCRGRFECCASPPSESFEACVEREAAPCREVVGRASLERRSGYDPVRAAELFWEGHQLLDGCEHEQFLLWRNEPDALPSIFRGTLEPGEDCSPMGFDDFAALVSCAGLDHVCRPVESRQNSPFECQPRGTEGAPCLLDSDCDEGRCAGLLPVGECAPRASAGPLPVCRSDLACESLVCRDTNAEVLTCRPLSRDEVFSCGS